MGEPSRQAAHGEEDGEHLGRKAKRPIDDARVEVDVGVQLAFDEIVVGQSDLFEFHGHLQKGIVDAQLAEDVGRSLLDDPGSGIEVLVDAVAKAHQTERVVLVFGTIDIVGDVAVAGDHVFEHLDHFLVGAPV